MARDKILGYHSDEDGDHEDANRGTKLPHLDADKMLGYNQDHSLAQPHAGVVVDDADYSLDTNNRPRHFRSMYREPGIEKYPGAVKIAERLAANAEYNESFYDLAFYVIPNGALGRSLGVLPQVRPLCFRLTEDWSIAKGSLIPWRPRDVAIFQTRGKLSP
ncbi:hypothetical protein EMCG_09546 [[Emmonsia] crescens]|uniref:Uncharacterized protein n=1 Tax=[Emmonsia] crescens TaxID=73230 RepID=A0A0G2I2S7_9EURO|nr:hypothetical protein EMCG_09546 [Emmonsia crescens UAMH 3008]